MRTILSCILFSGLFLFSCTENPLLAPSPAPTFSQTPLLTRTSIPSATSVIIATSTLNNKTIVINPDDLFSLPGLQVISTPASADFCEQIPPPQISSNFHESSILSGQFFFCPSRSRPWVNSAMDLDTGILVAYDNEGADIVMEYAHVPIDGTISYYVMGLNTGHIDEVETNTLSYEYCENVLASLVDRNDSGILNVHDEATSCVLTTEGQIAIIRVEEIYPFDTQSVAFSFAILRNE